MNGSQTLLRALTVCLCLSPAALADEGSLHAWGDDLFGPVSGTPTDTGFVAVAAGSDHNLALDISGGLHAWGHNSFGQGVVPAGLGGMSFQAIGAGDLHSLAIDADGWLYAWGDDFAGQVGMTPTDERFIAVDGGLAHTVAIAEDGTVHAWGWDGFGQVRDTPTSTPADEDFVPFVAVAAGDDHSLALDANGKLHAWGDTTFGQGEVPATLEAMSFVAIAAGGYHNVALDADGQLHAWGYDGEGQVSHTPSGPGFVAIAAGWVHNIAIDADGQLHIWGDLGNERLDRLTGMPDGPGFVAAAAGYGHTVAIHGVPTPPSIEAPILVRPDADEPTLNLRSAAPLPVAILSTLEFDALDVDAATVRLVDPALMLEGATGVAPVAADAEDVSGNGVVDLVLYFDSAQFGEAGAFDDQSVEAMLFGLTFDGIEVFGFDDVIIVGPPPGRGGGPSASSPGNGNGPPASPPGRGGR